MTKEQLKEKIKDKVEYSLFILPEDQHPDDCFGLEPRDQKQVVEKILKDLEWNPYAWFCAHVMARYKGFQGHDYLGACSYKNEQDFMNDGYYHDMKSSALDQLCDDILASKVRLDEIFA